jgi:hypothetical protein
MRGGGALSDPSSSRAHDGTQGIFRPQICFRGLPNIPLPHIAVGRAGQEVERCILSHDALHGVSVRAKDLRVRVPFGKRDAISSHAHGPSPSARSGTGAQRRVSRVLDVKDANVIGSRYDSAVVRIGHELHGEDVPPMARQYRRCEAELGRGRLGMIGMDVDAVVVGARG